MKLLHCSLSLAFSATSLCARDLAPKYWIENVAATDASVQTSLVFRTVAGVNYVVETSDNLTSWEEGEEFYGLGHDYVVPMRQFTPPPPPPPGSPPAVLPPRPDAAPTLMMRPSSALAGGTVVAWRSLDHGGPMTVLLDEDMHEDWESVPLFAHRYGAYYFFIWHPNQATAPPAENSPLGPRDSAMIAQMTASLPDMNQLVATSAALVRNSPPPVPVAPGPKKFWRIRADWSCDTDGDGSPDWAEFEIMADLSHPSNPVANAFSGDANNDGNIDRPDTDRDDVPDAFDADLGAKGIDWEKTGAIRFAGFEVEPPADPWGYSQSPLHASDLGHVVFPYGIWSKGSYVPVQRDGLGVANCRIIAMNDLFGGTILGYGNYDKDGDGYQEQGCHMYWYLPSDTPAPIRNGDNYATLRFPQITNPGSFLGNDGSFIGNMEPGTGPVRWVIPLNGGDASAHEAYDWASSNSGSGVLWGGQQSYIDGVVRPMPGFYDNLAFTPSGTVIACSSVQGKPAIYKNGAWTVEPSMPDLKEFSQAGYGATSYPVTLWSDGRNFPLATAAPGLPDDWKSQARMRDISDDGNMLLGKEASGYGEPSKYALAVPIIIKDDVEFTGVDAVSVTSTAPGAGVNEKLWIMAPADGENTVRFKTTANEGSCPLTLAASPANFNPGTLSGPEVEVIVGAAQGSASGDHDVTITNGIAPSITKPVGVKVMKSRTVRVSVYPVRMNVFGEGILFHDPDFALGLNGENENVLALALDKVFQKQINARFLVKLEAPVVKNWDMNNNQIFEADPDSPNGPEQAAVMAGLPASTFEPHIRVFVIGGPQSSATHRQRGLINALNNAITNPNDNIVWMSGSSREGRRTQTKFERTLAHEVGHVMLDWGDRADPGFGHPDKEGGVAPLPGTDRTRRIMVSGESEEANRGNLLVKTEWDRIEEWLNDNVEDDE